ncbi:PREDICTED: metalloendopeptidase OMA1, mitochondrial-like [Amphimedon queenslandica]|uniref:Metalloendopeptidase OMA1, mitochondrial n=1 Tax=Amphimedon queenslandica TaxID=400682 RepID=A0A1X7UDX8_AMPQE|nr:PREDICTED: metalloendopeptidase OMA1, mitochondrial-like [Amphimedon queenslandica]|eukprot:XP_003388335.1 PREDICTED: metalloendopeptidase OMA1, mitochondrial-like [Amphimedon queenslandica]
MASITCSMLVRSARFFHTTPSFRAPPIWLFTQTGTFVVAFSARAAREVWKRLPEARKVKIKASLKRQRKYFYGAGSLFLAGGGVYYFTHLEFVPLTKRYRFMMYSRDDRCQLLKQEMGTVGPDNALNLKTLNFIGDHKVLPASHQYYTNIVFPLVRQIVTHNSWCEGITDIDWRITIVDNPESKNIASLPTGDIIIYSGMLNACHNIDEASLMLSHEMAHIILNHAAEDSSYSHLVSMLKLVCIAAIWFFIPSVLVSFFTHVVFNKTKILSSYYFRRKREIEADQVGLLLASKACFNPERAIKLWKHLPKSDVSALSDTVKEYFRVHPCNERRFMILQSLLPQAEELHSSGQCESQIKKEMEAFSASFAKLIKRNIIYTNKFGSHF